jgi:hypothetical protein
MKEHFFSALFCILSLATALGAYTYALYIIAPHLTTDEIITVNVLLVMYYLLSNAGIDTWSHIRYRIRTKKIQNEIDTERAFRKLGG